MDRQGLIGKVLRFAMVGGLVTALHFAIAIGIVEKVVNNPPLANGIAYTVATVFNYLLNATWTFTCPLRKTNLVRFLAVSILALGMAAGLSWMVDREGYHYLWGILAVAFVIPPATFLLHHAWTFAVR